jgi:eukaryotic-like serine/threonine-protein kinase
MSTTVPEAVGAATFKYWAFLSYSHRDRKWGDWLHRALETYPVPKKIVGQPTRDGQRPRKLFPIFRDREELSVSADLGTEVNEALTRSRYLVVVCSRNSAKSVWVNEEIKFFKRLGREDRVLALIVAGEPNASDGKPGFTAEDECFPDALRYRVGPDGRLLSIRAEPVAGDAREGKDGKANAKLKLVAGLLDVSFDSLKQREQERRRRSLIAVAATSGAIAILMTTLAGYAFVQRQKAREQARLAENRRLAAQASERQANDAREQADGLINFMLHDLRDKLQPIGRLDVLDDVARKAKEYLDNLPKELLTTSRFRQQADLLNNLGDVLVAQGKLPEALDAYQQSLKIRQIPADQDKTNTGWQRDLLDSYVRLGDVLMAQGKLPDALDSYQQSSAIAKRLAEQDKANTDWQHYLVVSYEKIGDALEAQGKLAEALGVYRQSSAIAKRLAEQDRTNTGWQRDLSVSHNKVGDGLEAQGKLSEALDAYQQSLSIIMRLAEQDKTNSGWQRDLFYSYERVGRVLEDQGKFSEALNSYQQSSAIIKRLAEQDKTNSSWQRDLEIVYTDLGEVMEAQGKLPEALDAYRNAFAIMGTLTSRDASNAEWQNNAAWIRYRIAEVLMQIKEGDRNEAKRLVAEGIDIVNRLKQRNALPSYIQDTLDKLNELANALSPQSRE